jgi:phosphoglycolate phosphatase
MPAYQLVIFDFDGTLADSSEWMVRTFSEVAHRFGARPISLDEARALRECSTRDVVARLGTPLWRLPQIAADAPL